MKKLFTLLFAASLALTIQAQDITNTLGADGNFFVNKTGGTPSYLTLSSTADHTMQFSTNLTGFTIKNSTGAPVFAFKEFHDIAALTMLTIGHADANWLGGNFSHLQLQSENHTINNKFSMVARGAINYFNAYESGGTEASPTSSVDGRVILGINAYGYQTNENRLAASIHFKVDGTPAGIFVPGEIVFSTGTNTVGEIPRMTIESNGRVNIATVLKLTPGTAPTSPEKGDIYMDDTASKLKCWDGGTWQNLW